MERYRILYCVAQPPVPSSYCPISWRLWTWTCTASLCSNKNSEHCIRQCAYLWTREREISVLYTTKMCTLITLYIVHECFEMTMSLYSMRMSYIYASWMLLRTHFASTQMWLQVPCPRVVEPPPRLMALGLMVCQAPALGDLAVGKVVSFPDVALYCPILFVGTSQLFYDMWDIYPNKGVLYIWMHDLLFC